MDRSNIAKTDVTIQSKPAEMSPSIRYFALTAHIIFSVGWLGAVVTYIALAIAGFFSTDAGMVKVVYPALELIGWNVIVPLSLTALLTGVIQSLGTKWGLFRYYWVLMKFLLTFGASVILVIHMSVVSRMAKLVGEGMASGPDFERLRGQLLIHAAGGLIILTITTVLSVYKPWGKAGFRLHSDPEQDSKRWPRYLLFGLTGLLVLAAIIHIITGGMNRHN